MIYPDNVRPGEKGVIILDQTLLPLEEKYIELCTAEEMYEAIHSLRVRGAPAIGIFAAYAMAALSRGIEGEGELFRAEYKRLSVYLCSSRPTAVNLSCQLERMERVMEASLRLPRGELLDTLAAEAEQIQREDIEMCRRISEYGLSLLNKGDGLLTHCNAGPIATSVYGTGLGPILLGQERGYEFKAFVDETRPLLQGARLTSWELSRAGVDVTLICDNMASLVMREGKINAVLVGCDRVAMNGDTANKIGTSGAAVLAKHYGIPFYVLGPVTTIDPNCPTGENIVIEQRGGGEIKQLFFEKPSAPENVKCYNPAFDVTPAELITAIITDRGILRAPYTESIKAALAK